LAKEEGHNISLNLFYVIGGVGASRNRHVKDERKKYLNDFVAQLETFIFFLLVNRARLLFYALVFNCTWG
jgi:hypothetical protein